MSESPPTHPCPQCGQPVAEPADPAVNLLECPNCGNQFFIKRTAAPRRFSDESEIVDRVHDLAAGRRELIRTRSWFIIGALGCFVGLGQMIYWLAAYHAWTRTGQSVLMGFAVVFLVGVVYFARRAWAVTRFLNRK